MPLERRVEFVDCRVLKGCLEMNAGIIDEDRRGAFARARAAFFYTGSPSYDAAGCCCNSRFLGGSGFGR